MAANSWKDFHKHRCGRHRMYKETEELERKLAMMSGDSGGKKVLFVSSLAGTAYKTPGHRVKL